MRKLGARQHNPKSLVRRKRKNKEGQNAEKDTDKRGMKGRGKAGKRKTVLQLSTSGKRGEIPAFPQ